MSLNHSEIKKKKPPKEIEISAFLIFKCWAAEQTWIYTFMLHIVNLGTVFTDFSLVGTNLTLVIFL